MKKIFIYLGHNVLISRTIREQAKKRLSNASAPAAIPEFTAYFINSRE